MSRWHYQKRQETWERRLPAGFFEAAKMAALADMAANNCSVFQPKDMDLETFV